MRATRLVTLDWLFCHVGQYTISIFILFSDLSSIAAGSAGTSLGVLDEVPTILIQSSFRSDEEAG
jgi:hypothetical protein